MDFHLNNWNPSHQLGRLGFQNEHNNSQLSQLGTDNSFHFPTNPTSTGHHSNSQIPNTMIGLPTPPLGQDQPCLMTQAVTETRRTIVSPNGLQLQRIIDYYSIQCKPSSLPLNQPMHVTETVRTTRLLTPASTMDRLLGSGPSSCNFPLDQQVVSSLNQPMNRRTNLGSFRFQNRFTFPNNLGRNWSNLNVRDFTSGPRSLPGQNQVGFRSMNLGFKNTDERPSTLVNSGPKFYDLNACNRKNARNSTSEASHDHEVASDDQINEGSDHGDDTKYDGRTHSLPTMKYGPYTCPKCRVVFSTSQTFAAHANTHYKLETKEERKRRLAAKQRKRKLCFFLQAGNGSVTAVPKSGKGVAEALLRERNIALGKDGRVEKDHLKQCAGVRDPSVAFAKVKEEPV